MRVKTFRRLIRRLLLVGSVFSLAGGHDFPAPSAAAQSTGTLIVEISGAKYAEGRRVWVYLSEEVQLRFCPLDGSPCSTFPDPAHDKGIKRLFAKGTIEGETLLQGEVPAGRYYFILVSAERVEVGSVEIIGGLSANRSCNEVAEVKPGTVTRVLLDVSKGSRWHDIEEGCYIPANRFSQRVQVLLSSATAELLRYERQFQYSTKWCAKQAAPLFAISSGERLKRPVVILPETELTKELNIHDLEHDAEEIRYFVQYLSARCWDDLGFPWDSFQVNAEERKLAEILDERVKNERAKIESLGDEIADDLETIERSEKK
jgi:hypothetical protein